MTYMLVVYDFIMELKDVIDYLEVLIFIIEPRSPKFDMRM